ncbi:lasso peptide biosynthesis B2 protein [Evansella clarkii]|uniref:lasso peptide biosynthesis B2 protein n=1 Tax=Evansella clarkii TaxID=79879 RepID=UPI0009974CEE|nr:lasso peptide biosynthesis B2 protein [Evansella clarkii]
MINKARSFWSLDRQVKSMLFEAYVYLAWARLLKLLPFYKIAPSLGEHMEETNYIPKVNERKTISQVSQTVHMMSRYTFWESECLVKAIASLKMLEKRGIESTLYLGTRKSENGVFAAHAWLRSGPYYITGAEGMEKFTVVSKFAKRLSVKNGGETYG